MNHVRHLLQRAAPKLTKGIAVLWGETFPLYYVSEYPKSGGTWLGRMVSDYLQVPFPQHSLAPLAMTCVIHNHWSYHPRFRRIFYIMRDGRDVMVSFYFHRMRALKYGDSVTAARYRRRYERLYGRKFDPDDVVRLLPRFIEHEFQHPRDCRMNWVQHVRDWYRPEARPDIAYVRYEDLLNDTVGTLARALEHVTHRQVDDWSLRTTVEKFSFARQTGRTPGAEDRASFLRKGIAGDWQNYFSREAAEVFDRLAGDLLIELGYEQDRSWVARAA